MTKELMRSIAILIIVVAGLFNLHSQSVGVRAGWNLSKFDGPLETHDTFKLNNGFHFGINYGYKFSNKFMLRTELLYNQVGSKQIYNGPSYYLIYTADKTVYEKGKKTINLEITNSYISLPVSGVWSPSPKFEIFGGVSANFLASSGGRGTLRFESDANPDNIVFRQALDYRYYNDEAKTPSSGNLSVIKIRVDGKIVELPKSIGAYYQTDAKVANQYKWYNFNTFAGFNYFLNRGFYAGVRYEYGLTDVTNDKMDHSQENLNENYSFIKRKDKDRQITWQLSVGFRF